MKKPKPCKVNGIHYKSGNDAAAALGIPRSTLRMRLTSPNFPQYSSKHYPKTSIERTFVSCSIDGVEYRSISSASKKLGIPTGKIKRRLVSFHYPGYVCAKHPKRKRESHKFQGQPCMINGVRYKSENAAANALGTGAAKLRYRLKSSNFPEYISESHPKIDVVRNISCSIAGIEYRNAGEASRKLGIPYHETQRRLAAPDYPDYVSPHIPKRPTKTRKYTKRPVA